MCPRDACTVCRDIGVYLREFRSILLKHIQTLDLRTAVVPCEDPIEVVPDKHPFPRMMVRVVMMMLAVMRALLE